MPFYYLTLQLMASSRCSQMSGKPSCCPLKGYCEIAAAVPLGLHHRERGSCTTRSCPRSGRCGEALRGGWGSLHPLEGWRNPQKDPFLQQWHSPGGAVTTITLPLHVLAEDPMLPESLGISGL